MRILHTSDWHLGRTLEGRSRQSEQVQFVDEICRIADEEEVNLILIAGDVFDTYNPPAFAEELYCEALERLAQARKRAVVVVAGNHDSPDRLRALRPLASRHGVFIAGMPQEILSQNFVGSGVRLLKSGPGWINVAVPGVNHAAVVSHLPYPSESRLREVLSESLCEVSLRVAYSHTVNKILKQQSEAFSPQTVNIAVSHLFTLGGSSSESERPIELGGACTVDVSHLPASAQYVALGHLHRPQEVKQAPTKAFYSGSPLAYSFSESGQSKVVYIVEIKPDSSAQVKAVALSAGIPLEKWRCTNGVGEAISRLASLGGRSLWIDLEIYSSRFLTLEETARLRQSHEGLINVRCIVQGTEQNDSDHSLATLTVSELFARYYRHRKGGQEPSEELVRLFTELANLTATENLEVGEK